MQLYVKNAITSVPMINQLLKMLGDSMRTDVSHPQKSTSAGPRVNHLSSARVTVGPSPVSQSPWCLPFASYLWGCWLVKAEMQKYILKAFLGKVPEQVLILYTPKPAVPTSLTKQFPWINFW